MIKLSETVATPRLTSRIPTYPRVLGVGLIATVASFSALGCAGAPAPKFSESPNVDSSDEAGHEGVSEPGTGNESEDEQDVLMHGGGMPNMPYQQDKK